MNKQFFIDFDGTITTRDTVLTMVENFGGQGWQELNRKWENKELSTEECARETLKLFRTDLNELQKMLDTIVIDEYFPEFLDLCQSRGFKVYILSDGYDFNIRNILNRYNISLPFYSNKLLYTDHFDIECIYINENCSDCGTCKTGLMQQLQETGSEAVYIGDGYSDTCPAQHADQVFAKSSLLKFCRQNGIKAVPFDNFKDIIRQIESEIGQSQEN
ncbi:MAG TPA: MtnX-like HAD-IB family phosphatase [Syntrophomonadaceae bacterium]|nr:MtnX-like HAD-IB family phosphatase [Syntrophomonadaceae bacterium]